MTSFSTKNRTSVPAGNMEDRDNAPQRKHTSVALSTQNYGSRTMKFKSILLFSLQMLLLKFTSTLSQIKNIVSPRVDYSNNQIGTMSFTAFITTDFEYSTSTLKDLIFRIEYPFPLTQGLSVSWVKITDTCVLSSNLKTTTSVASSIPLDSTGAHFFTLVGANYEKDAQYKLVVKIVKASDIPITLGFTDPVKLSIVSSMSQYFITYASTSNLVKFQITSAGFSDFEYDLTPSYDDRNLQTFTRDFVGQADVRIYSQDIARILIKLDNYVFSDDAESTCRTIPNTLRNIQMIDRNDFYCEFEAADKKGLYFIWKEGKFAPLQMTFRLRFRIRNPNLPSSSNMQVAMMERYSPRILKYKSISNAYSCGPAEFGLGFPKLYVGPNLDTTSQFFPNVTLFTMMLSRRAVIFNSLRFQIKLSVDLPQPNSHYIVRIRIAGNAQTVIPKSFFYHDLPVANGQKNVFINIDPTTRDIELINVGSLSSRLTYNIGLKVAYYGTETDPFVGVNSFGSIEVLDSSGVSVIRRAAPAGIRDSFRKAPQVNTWPVRFNTVNEDWPTMLHTKLSTQNAAADFNSAAGGIWTLNQDTAPNYGMEKGTNLQFVFKMNLQSTAFSSVNLQSYIEIITHSSITATPIAGDWTLANSATNCHIRSQTGADFNTGPVKIGNCFVETKNLGLFGSEYTRFRMSPANVAFWSTNVANYYSYIWKGTTVTKQNSILFDDVDAAILDSYINIYDDTFSQDPSINYVLGLKFSYLDNMIVKNWTQFTNTKIEYMNYLRASVATETLDGRNIPTFLRVGGTFDNIDTFNSNRVVLFYTDFNPLFKDLDDPYEIGCSTSSTASVRCYHREGVPFINCDQAQPAKICTNELMKSRIEILLSSTIISISNFYSVQVLIPISIPQNAPTSTVFISVGTARGHFSTLSAYPQMLSFQRLALNRPTNYLTTRTLATFTVGEVQAGTRQQHVLMTSNGLVGNAQSEQIKFVCSDAVCSLPVPVPGVPRDFFGMTMCAHFNFMSESNFEVKNAGSEAYEQCAYRIQYQYLNGATVETKYCFFCPLFSSGAAVLINYENFMVPSQFGLNWPVGTFMGMTGARGVYGLYSIVDHSLLSSTPTKFFANAISDLSFDPPSIPIDVVSPPRNMDLTIRFTVSNALSQNSFIVFSTLAGSFSFSFKISPSPYCSVGTLSVKQSCSIIVTAANNFYLQISSAIPVGTVELLLYGLTSVNQNSAISVRTYTSGGMASNFMIDQSSALVNLNPRTFQWVDIDSLATRTNARILKTRNFSLKESNQGFRTTLTFDVHLPLYVFDLSTPLLTRYIYKKFQVTDQLKIDLGDASYSPIAGTPQKLVSCEILKLGTQQIIPQFKSCRVDNLNNILIDSWDDTLVNNFTVKLTNFEVPALTSITNTDARIRFINDAAFQVAAIESNPSWTIFGTVSTLAVFSVEKFVLFTGLRTHLRITFRTVSTPIQYESRVYFVFPFMFSPNLGSFPISCYLNTAPLKPLFCNLVKERTLEITGFDPGFAAGANVLINIFGVEQPAVVDSEDYIIGVDSNDDPTQLSETGLFNYATLPVSVGSTIPLLEILRTDYSHSYIRAKNNLVVQIRSSIDILQDWTFYVYIDYLDFEYPSYGDTGTCIIQLTESSPSLSENCVREGNRFAIKVKVGSTLTQNIIYTMLINNIPTPDFTVCDSKKLDIYVVDSSAPPVLQLISTDFFQNSDVMNFRNDDKLVYVDFVGQDRKTPITIRKGVFNKIEVKREDAKRFNDDFTFTLANTANGLLSQLPNQQMQLFDSMFGLSTYPIYVSSNLNTFTHMIPTSITQEPRFQKQAFSVFPLLRLKLANQKLMLKVPEIIVYQTIGSLQVYIELDLLPLVDVTFDITFDMPTCTSCVANPTFITLGQTNRRRIIRVLKPTNILTEVSSKIIFTPRAPTATGYGITEATILILDPIPSYTSLSAQPANIQIIQADPSSYGLKVDILNTLPFSFYSITIPVGLYRKFGSKYLIDKYESNQQTDQFYYITYTASQKTTNLNFELVKNELRANEKYKTTIYYSQIGANNYIDAQKFEFEFTTQDTAGGTGYLNITFATAISDANKPKVVCQIAQILSYPLEKQVTFSFFYQLASLQTSDGFRCPSVYLQYPTNTVEMDVNMLSKRILTENTIYNLRESQSKDDNRILIESQSLNGIREHRDRELQLTIVTPNSGETPKQATQRLKDANSQAQGVKLQIIFLKNLKEHHSTSLYFETQSATMQKDFGSKMGNFLKDYPLILGFSPLISFRHETPMLYDDTQIYNLRGNLTAQITEFTAFNRGRIFGMILFNQTEEIEKQITPLHVKRGINLGNQTALRKMEFIVDDLTGMSPPVGINHFTPESKIWMNLEGLPWDPTKNTTNATSSATTRILEDSLIDSIREAFRKTYQQLVTLPYIKEKRERILQAISSPFERLRRQLETTTTNQNLTSASNSDPVDAEFNQKIFWEKTMPNTNLTEYTLFYVSTDQTSSDWTQHSEVKKIRFKLYGSMQEKFGLIKHTGLLVTALLVIFSMTNQIALN